MAGRETPESTPGKPASLLNLEIHEDPYRPSLFGKTGLRFVYFMPPSDTPTECINKV